jgi:hypothetical protein
MPQQKRDEKVLTGSMLFDLMPRENADAQARHGWVSLGEVQFLAACFVTSRFHFKQMVRSHPSGEPRRGRMPLNDIMRMPGKSRNTQRDGRWQQGQRDFVIANSHE